ncbi:hypothetical protein ACFW3Y_35830, partial [Streptomyces rochei]|uniref:hypothetical protein n=1 Tax=Streptomyces rochei TaxID=1928 RepID=UPI0036B6D7A9
HGRPALTDSAAGWQPAATPFFVIIAGQVLGRFAAPGSKYASLMRELLTQGTTFGGMAQQWAASQKLCRSSGGAVRIRDHSERERQDSRGDGDAGIA